MRQALAWCIAVTVLAAGCGGDRAAASSALVGAWEHQGKAPDATTPPPWQRFEFEADGRARWIVGSWSLNDTFAIRYKVDARSSPAKVDLSGFDHGSLRDRTLYCIADLSGVASAGNFRMDCEPGQGGASPEAVRPTAFTEQMVTYKRAR